MWVSQKRAAELLGVTPRGLRMKTPGLTEQGVTRQGARGTEYQTVGLALAWLNLTQLQMSNWDNFARLERMVRDGRELGE
jgi:hypothetical protein